jgi:hypothetical protein
MAALCTIYINILLSTNPKMKDYLPTIGKKLITTSLPQNTTQYETKNIESQCQM